MNHPMDKLYEAVEARGHVCVGLDTAPEYLPPRERRRAAGDAEAVLAYNRALIDATADIAACYKVQIACYEEGGLAGLSTYAQTLAYLRQKGCPIIADIKRGDIADTAARYARAHFEGDFAADFVTLSPYMGMDTLDPWIAYADKGKGAFVLMRTSNPGMRDFEYLELKTQEGGVPPATPPQRMTDTPRRLYHAVGDRLTALAAAHRGIHGYGAFGAVVGCTEREEAAAIRARYPDLFFLIPGYGAQGGAAEDAALLLRQGNGGVVNASRSILRAWAAETAGLDPETVDNSAAAEAARKAVIVMRDAIRAAAPSTSSGAVSTGSPYRRPHV